LISTSAHSRQGGDFYTLLELTLTRKVLESVILRFLITAKRLEKSPEILRFQDFSGCGGRTRTYGLRVMSSK